ncbi:unnamed protein product [Timema podura]|uniref:C2H2-type domain-containing protein n=1 Tax=Timema podura TaxID=61482 RepID=A0ABN7PEJ8_TIMPD|nr:unnamed protein product [Timema podura]
MRAFNQKGSLQIHMTKHNGLKPFPCDFCSAMFSQRGNLRAHIIRVHTIPTCGEQVYKCNECPCAFKKLGSLNASHESDACCRQGVENPTCLIPYPPTSMGNLDSTVSAHAHI